MCSSSHGTHTPQRELPTSIVITACIQTQRLKKTSPPFVPKPMVKRTDTENEKPSKKLKIAVLQLSGTVVYRRPKKSSVEMYCCRAL